MAIALMKHQQLAARDDNGRQGNEWGPLQIAAPAIVGGVLLVAFAAYVIWRRRPTQDRNDYDYHKVRTASKIERIFVPRRRPRRLRRARTPMVIDDSMGAPAFRSDSSDSQTPLTTTNHYANVPPNRKLSDPPPPIPKPPIVRWWRLLGSRPQEVKSEEPGSRWRIDGPDGSNNGHGGSNHEREAYRPRYFGYLETSQEDPEDGGVGAIPTRPIREMSTVQDRAGPSVSRIPVPTTIAFPRNNSDPTASLGRGLSPGYHVSRNHTPINYPSVPSARSEIHMALPPPPRTAEYSSFRAFHGREPSYNGFLAAQNPMAVAAPVC